MESMNKKTSAYQGKKKSSRSDNTKNNWTAIYACGQKLSSEFIFLLPLESLIVLFSTLVKFKFDF